MKIINKADPWEHFEVENLLNDTEFNIVSNYMSTLEQPKTKRIMLSQSIHNNVGDRKFLVRDEVDMAIAGNSFTTESSVSNITIEQENIFNILSKAFTNLLKELNCDSNPYYCFQLGRTSPKYCYKTHQDEVDKIFTFVYHISEKGVGTRLHLTEKDPYVKTTKWIRNGGQGFFRDEHTWHSYDTLDFDDIRQCIVMILYKK
jgi:hypothetical protein